MPEFSGSGMSKKRQYQNAGFLLFLLINNNLFITLELDDIALMDKVSLLILLESALQSFVLGKLDLLVKLFRKVFCINIIRSHIVESCCQ